MLFLVLGPTHNVTHLIEGSLVFLWARII